MIVQVPKYMENSVFSIWHKVTVVVLTHEFAHGYYVHDFWYAAHLTRNVHTCRLSILYIYLYALNYSALLHPEILATKHGGNKNELTSGLETNIAPTELNLAEG
jgi:hypothetical protein